MKKRKMVYNINKSNRVYNVTDGLEPTHEEVRKDRLSRAILKSFPYRRKSARIKNIKCKDIDKLQTIVDHYNNHLFHYDDALDLHLYLEIDDITKGEMRRWKAIWKGVEGELDGEGHFYEKAAWCRDTLYNKHLDALIANARLGNKKTGKTGTVLDNINLEDQWYLAHELGSFIEDCNRYLLNKALVHLGIDDGGEVDYHDWADYQALNRGPVANATHEVQSSLGDTQG
jgi:hypothetical protein